VLTRVGATWQLAAGSLSGRLLSRDLAAVLAARIDALPPDARAVLRDAAVVGDTVPLAALAAMREQRSTSDTRPAAVAALDLDRAMDELLHRRMLMPTRGGFVFATPLLREAAYAGVGKADLADRHAHLVRGRPALTLPAPSLGWTADTLDAFIGRAGRTGRRPGRRGQPASRGVGPGRGAAGRGRAGPARPQGDPGRRARAVGPLHAARGHPGRRSPAGPRSGSRWPARCCSSAGSPRRWPRSTRSSP
jgi:hypothetical protein